MPGIMKHVSLRRRGSHVFAGVCAIVHAKYGRGTCGVPIQSYSHCQTLTSYNKTLVSLDLHCSII